MENRIYFEEKKKALSMFRWTLRKQLPFSIAYWILLLLSFPVVNILIMIIVNANIESGGSISGYVDVMEYFAHAIVGSVFSLIAIAHSAIMAIMTFSYLHNKRSVDLFGSLPTSRRTMFFSRYCGVIASNVAPIMVIGTIGALLTARVSTVIDIYKVLGSLMLVTIGNISIVAFISLCCGKVGDVIVSYVIVNIVYPICVYIISAFPMEVVPGVPKNYLPATVYTLLSPVAAHFTAIFGTGRNIHYIWWLALTIILIAGSYILCNKRKAETAQNAFAFAAVEIVIKFITCFATGFGVGWIMTQIGTDIDPLMYNGYETEVVGSNMGWFVFGFIVGDMIANGLLHLIYHRGFSKFKASLKECFVVFGTGMVFLLVVTSGVFGYDRRIPDIEDVESVHIEFDSEHNQQFIINGENLLEEYYDDEEMIKSVIGVHQNLVDNMTEKKGLGLYPIIGYYGYSNSNMNISTVQIKYKLKNGSTMTRYYSELYGDIVIPTNLKHLPNDSEVLLKNVPTEYITEIELQRMGSNGNAIYLISREETLFNIEKINKIVDAIKVDYELIRETKKYTSIDMYEMEGEHNITIRYAYHTEAGIEVSMAYVYPITGECVNTLKALQETGYGNYEYYIFAGKYPVYEQAKSIEYTKTGDEIYFELPDKWRTKEEIHCVPYTDEYKEILLPLDDEMTICEKVSDRVYKYTIPENDEVSNLISGVIFYQYSFNEKSFDEFEATPVMDFTENGENMVRMSDAFGSKFEWVKYVE